MTDVPTALAAARQAVIRVAGDPERFAELVAASLPGQRELLVAEARKLYGNYFVARAVAGEVRGDVTLGSSAGPPRRPSQPVLSPPSVVYSTAQPAAFTAGAFHIRAHVSCVVEHVGPATIELDVAGGVLRVGAARIAADFTSPAALAGRPFPLDARNAEVAFRAGRSVVVRGELDGDRCGILLATTYALAGTSAPLADADGDAADAGAAGAQWIAHFSCGAFIGLDAPADHPWPPELAGAPHLVARFAALAASDAIAESAPAWSALVSS